MTGSRLILMILCAVVVEGRAEEVNRFAEPADIAHVDATITAFMEKYEVPGLSIALAKDGQIVLAKGYGMANKRSKIAVTPQHSFRIASVSKPITSIVIMKLVEMKRLSLDDRVFGPTGILGGTYRTKDEHLLQLTVRHLLRHEVGPE